MYNGRPFKLIPSDIYKKGIVFIASFGSCDRSAGKFMLNAPDAPKRIEILDSLRGFAALWVCWFHACIIFYPGSQTSWWSADGYLGVPVFYVISGFVIPYTLELGGYSYRNFGRFFVKRTVRLHPPFLASIGMIILVGAIADRVIKGANYHYGLKSVILNSLLIAPCFGEPWLLKAYWSLAVEIQWYVFAALLFGMYSTSASISRLAAFVLLSCIAGALAPLAARKELLLQYLPLFSMGVVVFRFITGTVHWRWAATLILVAVACSLYRLGVLQTVAGLLAAACIASVRRGIGLFNALGKVSYSLYLIHGLVLLHCRFTVPKLFLNNPDADQVARMLLGIGMSIMAAWILYCFAEKPSLVLSHRVRYK
jgi:peptidoglycan/LPS O-acetylase OafA/YrhL